MLFRTLSSWPPARVCLGRLMLPSPSPVPKKPDRSGGLSVKTPHRRQPQPDRTQLYHCWISKAFSPIFSLSNAHSTTAACPFPPFTPAATNCHHHDRGPPSVWCGVVWCRCQTSRDRKSSCSRGSRVSMSPGLRYLPQLVVSLPLLAIFGPFLEPLRFRAAVYLQLC